MNSFVVEMACPPRMSKTTSVEHSPTKRRLGSGVVELGLWRGWKCLLAVQFFVMVAVAKETHHFFSLYNPQTDTNIPCTFCLVKCGESTTFYKDEYINCSGVPETLTEYHALSRDGSQHVVLNLRAVEGKQEKNASGGTSPPKLSTELHCDELPADFPLKNYNLQPLQHRMLVADGKTHRLMYTAIATKGGDETAQFSVKLSCADDWLFIIIQKGESSGFAANKNGNILAMIRQPFQIHYLYVYPEKEPTLPPATFVMKDKFKENGRDVYRLDVQGGEVASSFERAGFDVSTEGSGKFNPVFKHSKIQNQLLSFTSYYVDAIIHEVDVLGNQISKDLTALTYWDPSDTALPNIWTTLDVELKDIEYYESPSKIYRLKVQQTVNGNGEIQYNYYFLKFDCHLKQPDNTDEIRFKMTDVGVGLGPNQFFLNVYSGYKVLNCKLIATKRNGRVGKETFELNMSKNQAMYLELEERMLTKTRDGNAKEYMREDKVTLVGEDMNGVLLLESDMEGVLEAYKITGEFRRLNLGPVRASGQSPGVTCKIFGEKDITLPPETFVYKLTTSKTDTCYVNFVSTEGFDANFKQTEDNPGFIKLNDERYLNIYSKASKEVEARYIVKVVKVNEYQLLSTLPPELVDPKKYEYIVDLNDGPAGSGNWDSVEAVLDDASHLTFVTRKIQVNVYNYHENGTLTPAGIESQGVSIALSPHLRFKFFGMESVNEETMKNKTYVIDTQYDGEPITAFVGLNFVDKESTAVYFEEFKANSEKYQLKKDQFYMIVFSKSDWKKIYVVDQLIEGGVKKSIYTAPIPHDARKTLGNYSCIVSLDLHRPSTKRWESVAMDADFLEGDKVDFKSNRISAVIYGFLKNGQLNLGPNPCQIRMAEFPGNDSNIRVKVIGISRSAVSEDMDFRIDGKMNNKSIVTYTKLGYIVDSSDPDIVDAYLTEVRRGGHEAYLKVNSPGVTETYLLNVIPDSKPASGGQYYKSSISKGTLSFHKFYLVHHDLSETKNSSWDGVEIATEGLYANDPFYTFKSIRVKPVMHELYVLEGNRVKSIKVTYKEATFVQLANTHLKLIGVDKIFLNKTKNQRKKTTLRVEIQHNGQPVISYMTFDYSIENNSDGTADMYFIEENSLETSTEGLLYVHSIETQEVTGIFVVHLSKVNGSSSGANTYSSNIETSDAGIIVENSVFVVHHDDPAGKGVKTWDPVELDTSAKQATFTFKSIRFDAGIQECMNSGELKPVSLGQTGVTFAKFVNLGYKFIGVEDNAQSEGLSKDKTYIITSPYNLTLRNSTFFKLNEEPSGEKGVVHFLEVPQVLNSNQLFLFLVNPDGHPEMRFLVSKTLEKTVGVTRFDIEGIPKDYLLAKHLLMESESYSQYTFQTSKLPTLGMAGVNKLEKVTFINSIPRGFIMEGSNNKKSSYSLYLCGDKEWELKKQIQGVVPVLRFDVKEDMPGKFVYTRQYIVKGSDGLINVSTKYAIMSEEPTRYNVDRVVGQKQERSDNSVVWCFTVTTPDVKTGSFLHIYTIPLDNDSTGDKDKPVRKQFEMTIPVTASGPSITLPVNSQTDLNTFIENVFSTKKVLYIYSNQVDPLPYDIPAPNYIEYQESTKGSKFIRRVKSLRTPALTGDKRVPNNSTPPDNPQNCSLTSSQHTSSSNQMLQVPSPWGTRSVRVR